MYSWILFKRYCGFISARRSVPLVFTRDVNANTSCGQGQGVCRGARRGPRSLSHESVCGMGAACPRPSGRGGGGGADQTLFIREGEGCLLALRQTRQKKILTQNLAEGKSNLNKRPLCGTPPRPPPPLVVIPYKQSLAPDSNTPSPFWPPEGGGGAGVPGTPTHMPPDDRLVALCGVFGIQNFHPLGGMVPAARFGGLEGGGGGRGLAQGLGI